MRLKELSILCATVSALGAHADAASIIPVGGYRPGLRLEFQAQPDTTDVRNFFLGFAKAQNLALDDLGARVPSKSVGPILFLSLRREKSIEISVTNAPRSGLYIMGIYELQSDSASHELAARLVKAVREKWPDVRSQGVR